MKDVKIIMMFLIQMVATGTDGQTEKVRALYLNSRTFENSIALFDTKCKSGRLKIKLNDFFVRPYVTIKLNGGKVQIRKRDLFGYVNCNNKVFRFKGNKELLLLNEGDSILIYKHISAKSLGGRTNATNYYFSQGLHTPVELLTISNIKNRFRQNVSFCNSIETNFIYNTDLAEFNGLKKKFTINILLNQSLK